MPDDSGKLNSEKCYTNKYQKHVINSMIEESKYCTDIMRKYFNKKFVVTKRDNKDKYWICDHVYVESDVKVRDHCHITGKYRGSTHKDCNVNVNLNHKIPIVLHNLKSYDSHLIMQELNKLRSKINVLPNGLEKYMSFNINNKLMLIDSFQFLIT